MNNTLEVSQMNAEKQHEALIVETVRAMLACTEKGNIKRTRENCMMILANDPVLAGAFRFNLLTKQVHVVDKVPWDRSEFSEALTDSDLRHLYLYMEQNYEQSNDKYIDEALYNTAEQNMYHPIRDYLMALEWDGEKRIDHALHHFLGADDTDFNHEVFRLFLFGSLARIFIPGKKFDYMFCLVGRQGSGKSTFLRFLAIRDEWFSDDLRDIDKGGKVYEQLRGHWIIEFSEMLAMMNMKHNESIKSFISRTTDNYRLPYAKFSEDRARQCIFAGTTNKKSFLPDDKSGNRRFLPVQCHEEYIEADILADEAESRAYIDQVWAEAMQVWLKGIPPLVLPKEMQKVQKEVLREFTQEDADEGLIIAFFEDYTGDRICSRMIYKEALNHFDEPKRYQTNDICETVNQLILRGEIKGWRYFSSPKRFADYGTQKGWERICNVNLQEDSGDGFEPVPEQMVLPFCENETDKQEKRLVS